MMSSIQRKPSQMRDINQDQKAPSSPANATSALGLSIMGMSKIVQAFHVTQSRAQILRLLLPPFLGLW